MFLRRGLLVLAIGSSTLLIDVIFFFLGRSEDNFVLKMDNEGFVGVIRAAITMGGNDGARQGESFYERL